MGYYNNDDRRAKIIEFVKAHPKCTKTEVIKEMEDKGIGSIKTVHSIINDLVDKEKLIVLKDKPNSQVHRLVINEKNEFNRIDNTLSEIEGIMNRMARVINLSNKDESEEEEGASVSLDYDFIDPYFQGISAMLLDLLLRVIRMGAKDSQILILNKRIMKLIQKLRIDCSPVKDFNKITKGELNEACWDLEKYHLEAHELGRPQLKRLAERHNVDLKVGKELLQQIRAYKEEFLSD